MNHNDIQAEADDRYWRDHEDDETDAQIEVGFADLRIAELEAALRDIVFGCNQVLADKAFATVAASAIAAALRQKALAALTVTHE